MKQYTFKDGFKCVASSVDEAKEQHKSVACASRSNVRVVKIIKTIQLVKTKMDEALKQIQEKKDEMGGKKLLQDAYKELGKLI